jgi:uncharacterized RDD family membrane protein YckC
MDYGGFWIRFLAKILDGIILAVPMFLLGALAGTTAFGVDPQQTSFLVTITGNLLFYAIGAVYTIFFVGYFGATPGKMVCRLKIVTAEGGSVSYLRATGRYFAEILSGVICYIGYLLAPFDDQKRTLHDHICNTRVIRIER